MEYSVVRVLCLNCLLIVLFNNNNNNKHELIFSKVQESETETAWFFSSPFQVDLLDEKESVRTPIRHAGESEAQV
jgi:hypothetical protein